ncbi:MAG: transglycosylase family protein [Mycobacteriales bacterium]
MSFAPMLRARKTARHAKPSKAAPVIAAAGISASFVAADAAVLAASASAASSSASDSDLAKLRTCESGGNYATNTGNGYYGAYQFALQTWHSLGYPGRPDQASPATQDAAVRQLQARSGWGQWPACSARYGLGSGGSVSADSAAAPVHTDTLRASRSRSRFPTVSSAPASPRVLVAVAPTTPPPFLHRQLSVADEHTFRIGAQMWQQRMAQRGWPITVDGYFGPQSAAVAKAFAAEKNIRLTSALPGEVDRGVWDAAWRLPVD